MGATLKGWIAGKETLNEITAGRNNYLVQIAINLAFGRPRSDAVRCYGSLPMRPICLFPLGTGCNTFQAFRRGQATPRISGDNDARSSASPYCC